MNIPFRISSSLLLAVIVLTACQPVMPAEKADVVLTNGYIYTVDAKGSVAEAMAVSGDAIVYVGSNKGAQVWIGENTRVIDLHGRMILPGLVDSHAHAADAVSEIYEVSLYGLGSVDEIRQAIRDFVAATPGLHAVKGAGWINAVFGPNGPTKDILDEIVPNIPVILYSEDYHSVWINSKTFELAGITRDTSNPEGGIIERDAEGNPSGTLRENAIDLVAGVIPDYSVNQYMEGLKYFEGMAHSYGMTTVYIPSSDETTRQALHNLDAANELTIRFPTAVNANPGDNTSAVDQLVQIREQENGGNFWIAGVKIFMDGVLEGGTAYLEEPYLYKPDRGELLWDPQKYNEMCAALDTAGFQIHVHAIGDAATRITLDGFAYARQQNGKRDSRNMVTHLQLVNPADITRFADLNVIAVPQPYWFVVDTYYTQAVEYVGQERADRQYPMKSFFDEGVTVASSSDYPVTIPPDPMLAIEIGVTRTVPAGNEAYVAPSFIQALNAAEDVTVAQMITSFTINGAYAVFMENEIGSLEAGKKADFIVLDQNILQIKPSEIHNTKVLLTFFNGQEVYRSDAYNEE